MIAPNRGLRPERRGNMTENEQKVISLINRSSNKEKAVKVALALLVSLLADQEKTPADLPEVS